jgi:hypothetical protein
MTLADRIKKLVEDGKRPTRELNKAHFASEMLAIQAELEKPDLQIGLDVFEAMDNDLRQVALQGLVLISMTTLNES